MSDDPALRQQVNALERMVYVLRREVGELRDRVSALEAGDKPEPDPCPECGSLLAYSHNAGCSRGNP